MVSTNSEYAARKKKIHDHLGGACVKCSKTENLHVDHIDHTDKSFTIMPNWALSWDKLKVELAKCQLLCYDCHKQKTLKEGSLAKGWTTQPRQEHGTVNSYTKYKCRCDECKQAKSSYEKRLRQNQSSRSPSLVHGTPFGAENNVGSNPTRETNNAAGSRPKR